MVKALRAQDNWERLRSSLWFVPTLIVASAIVMAVMLVELDAGLQRQLFTERWPRLFGAGAEGSRGLLAAIAGSMITVAGVTFSITVVALALASSQYTSRILGNFMRDRANQAVLGVFLGVFAYCLVVLRTIRGGDEGVFVPALAVFVALLLALLAIGFLIFFIHHIAASIQATSIVATTARETLTAIDRLFPSGVGSPATDSQDKNLTQLRMDARSWASVPASATGYIQSINADALFELARKNSVVVRMERSVGEFVIEGMPLASLGPGTCAADVELIRALNEAYTLGKQRTVHQDAAYGIRQLVDVALKALSPGVNDTTTATSCIDYLGAILARLIDRQIETPHRSEADQLRLITSGPTFIGLLNGAFDQIRQNAESNVAVLSRLLEILGLLLRRANHQQRRNAILLQADLILETSNRSVPAAHDRATIQAAFDALAGRPTLLEE